MAQKLLFEGDRLERAYDNDRCNPKAPDIDSRRLLQSGSDDNPLTQLPSSDAVREIVSFCCSAATTRGGRPLDCAPPPGGQEDLSLSGHVEPQRLRLRAFYDQYR